MTLKSMLEQSKACLRVRNLPLEEGPCTEAVFRLWPDEGDGPRMTRQIELKKEETLLLKPWGMQSGML